MTRRLPALLAASLLTLALTAPRARAADVITWDSINVHAYGTVSFNSLPPPVYGTGNTDAPSDLTTFGQVAANANCSFYIMPEPPYYMSGSGSGHAGGNMAAYYQQATRSLSFDFNAQGGTYSSLSYGGYCEAQASASINFTLATSQIAHYSGALSSATYFGLDGASYAPSAPPPSTFLLNAGTHSIMCAAYVLGSSGGYGNGHVSLSLSGDGLSPNNAFIPSTITHGTDSTTWGFTSVPTGTWFDPPATSEFTYTMDPGVTSVFTDIQDFPEGFDAVTVTAEGQNLGTFLHSQSLNFAASPLHHAVSSFTVSGINPTVDAQDSTAFPLKLAFDTPTASFTMTSPVATPEDVPEPASLALLTLGTAALLARRRTRRSRT